MEWLTIFEKLLEQKRFYLALFLTGATTLYLNYSGALPPLNEPISWVALATIFGGWMCVINFLEYLTSKAAAYLLNTQEKRLLVGKLSALTDEQRYTLDYVKALGQPQFQGDSDDSVLGGLFSMGLLIGREYTDSGVQFYEVPKVIWEKIVVSAEQAQNLRDRGAPWVTRRRRNERRIF